MKPTSVKIPLPRGEAGKICASCEAPVGHAQVSIDRWEELGEPAVVTEHLSVDMKCVLCGERLRLVEPEEATPPPGEAA